MVSLVILTVMHNFWQRYVSIDFVSPWRNFLFYEYIYIIICLYTVIYSWRLHVFFLEWVFSEMRLLFLVK